MSKWVGEQMADAFARRRPGLVQIASFRFHLLVGPTEFGTPTATASTTTTEASCAAA
jgi:hypothetical protein